MAEEVLDVVDEMDRVVGSAPRRDIHARGLRHRAVHILVFNGAGDVFLQKRSMAKDMHPGKWDSSASGHVDGGEEYAAAAARELREELGVEADPGELSELGRIEACAETEREFVRVYRVVREGPFQINQAEISEGRFESPSRVGAWISEAPSDFARAFLEVWKRFGCAGAVPA